MAEASIPTQPDGVKELIEEVLTPERLVKKINDRVKQQLRQDDSIENYDFGKLLLADKDGQTFEQTVQGLGVAADVSQTLYNECLPYAEAARLLRRFGLQDLISDVQSNNERTFLARLWMYSVQEDEALELYKKCREKVDRLSHLIAPDTFGLDKEYKGTHDFKLLQDKIQKVFQWYTHEAFNVYMAPCFAIVQSSGMGKTRLMKEYAPLQESKQGSPSTCVGWDIGH